MEEAMPYLIINSGPRAGSVIELTQDVTVLGREEDCDIVLPDQCISRHHARIVHAEDQWMLEDLGSRNGTHINDTAIDKPTALGDKATISIGKALLRFQHCLTNSVWGDLEETALNVEWVEQQIKGCD